MNTSVNSTDKLIAHFFTFGGRPYVNNSVATTHALETIISLYGDVSNFSIKFKKPITSKAEFIIKPFEVDGSFVGHFWIDGIPLYFSYRPIDLPLETGSLSIDDIHNNITMSSLCYYVAETCHQAVLRSFEKNYGPQTSTDRSIFVRYDIVDTSILSEIVDSKIFPNMEISEPEIIGERRFKLLVKLNGKLLGFRYNTVKEFIL